jgi:hypothetical protein
LLQCYASRQNSAGSAAGLDGLGSEDEDEADNDNDNDADNDSQDEGQDQLPSAVDQQQQQQADGDGSSSNSSGYANSSSATAAVAAGERKARWLRKRAATQVRTDCHVLYAAAVVVVVGIVRPLSFDSWRYCNLQLRAHRELPCKMCEPI